MKTIESQIIGVDHFLIPEVYRISKVLQETIGHPSEPPPAHRVLKGRTEGKRISSEDWWTEPSDGDWEQMFAQAVANMVDEFAMKELRPEQRRSLYIVNLNVLKDWRGISQRRQDIKGNVEVSHEYVFEFEVGLSFTSVKHLVGE